MHLLAQDTVKEFAKLAAGNPEDDVVSELANLFAQRAAGKDVTLDIEGLGPVMPGALPAICVCAQRILCSVLLVGTCMC